MNVVLWITTGALGVVFLLAGGMKLARPKETLAASGLRWTEDISRAV
jgi:hypothetical protein